MSCLYTITTCPLSCSLSSLSSHLQPISADACPSQSLVLMEVLLLFKMSSSISQRLVHMID